jgi:hypothetical protein
MFAWLFPLGQGAAGHSCDAAHHFIRTCWTELDNFLAFQDFSAFLPKSAPCSTRSAPKTGDVKPADDDNVIKHNNVVNGNNHDYNNDDGDNDDDRANSTSDSDTTDADAFVPKFAVHFPSFSLKTVSVASSFCR